LQTRARTTGVVETVFRVPESFPDIIIPDPSARAVTAAEKYAKHTSTGLAPTPGITSIMSDKSSVSEVELEKERSRGKFYLGSTEPRLLRFVDVGELQLLVVLGHCLIL
jgi:hypothetical protein